MRHGKIAAGREARFCFCFGFLVAMILSPRFFEWRS